MTAKMPVADRAAVARRGRGYVVLVDRDAARAEDDQSQQGEYGYHLFRSDSVLRPNERAHLKAPKALRAKPSPVA